MKASFGDVEKQNDEDAFGSRVTLSDGPLGLTWLHCTMTSEFFGEFYALRGASSGLEYNEVRHSIGYLVNELLENAVKFRAPGDVVLESSLMDGRFELKLSNMIDEETSERFKRLLAEVTTRDPGDLLIERIEANAAEETSSGSGLGLLTLMSDYGANLGWTFLQGEVGKPMRLETHAVLNLT